MPAIELEEVQMVEASDDAMEFSSCVQAAATVLTFSWPC